MNKLFFVCVFALTFLFPCIDGFSDILKDLKSFEESLGDWVKQTDELSQRLSELERERNAREKQIADYNQSMANIENLITGLDAKVEKVAKMSSLKGVKDIVKSFEGTLNVFKKRFSKLAKRLEDQEVKTAVLERIYQTAQKPVETLISSIDEQKSVINKLAERLDKQGKLIVSMEDSLKKQTSPAESFTKGIEELNARLSKLESGVIVQRKGLKTEAEKHVAASGDHREETKTEEHGTASGVHHEKTEVATHAAAPDVHHKKAESEKHAVASKARRKKPKTPAQKTPEEKGLIDVGEGFFVKNIKFKPFGSSSKISGEIVNKSKRGYGMIDFKIQAYNKDNVPLGGLGFSIYGFKKGKVGTFEEIIAGVETKKITKYSIYPAQMSLVSDTGEKTIKIIEKKLSTAKAETAKLAAKEIAPENLEELLFDEGKKGIPKELEGFKDVGNGFYAGNVSFGSFGSSSSVKGDIKNNSKDDFFNVSFIMKIYSKAYGMITSFDFSVRHFKSGETKSFEEIVAGVRPVDIGRYEVAFKSAY
ncbi:MAG: hypothetical protein ACE5GV_02360 [Candidatus Scalindua sp.]